MHADPFVHLFSSPISIVKQKLRKMGTIFRGFFCTYFVKRHILAIFVEAFGGFLCPVFMANTMHGNGRQIASPTNKKTRFRPTPVGEVKAAFLYE